MPIGFESCTPRMGAPFVPLMVSSLAAFLWMRGSGNSSGYQKVGSVSPGLLGSLPGAPFGHFGVMPAYQDIRHLPATILGRARVVRVVQQKSRLSKMGIVGHRNGVVRFELADGFVLSTIPSPPPNGRSSTVLFRSLVNSRKSCT